MNLEKVPVWLIGVGLSGIVLFLGLQLLTGFHYCIGNEGGSIGWRGKDETCMGGDSVLVQKNDFNLFPADKVRSIQDNKSGDGMIHDFSEIVPDRAKGVILKVIIRSNAGTGSFVCADDNGAFPSGPHYIHNGVTNYTNNWVGGVVFCPLKENRTITWRTQDNQGAAKTVNSIASILGWF